MKENQPRPYVSSNILKTLHSCQLILFSLLQDLEDRNRNVVGLDEVECPNVVAEEENASLDFVDKFVRPNLTSFRQNSTSFSIPINDMFFKHKRCQLDKDEDEADNNPGTVT